MRKVARVLTLVLALTLLAPFEQSTYAVYPNVGVVQSGLLMYYDLGNYSGSSGTTLTELSGNFSNGALVQVNSKPSVDTSNGRFLSFDAGGGYVDLPDLAGGSAWTGLTISFYANFGSSVNAFERVMDFGNGSGVDNILVGRDYNSNALFVEIYNNTTSGGYCRSGAGAVNTNVSGNGVLGTNTWSQWNITVGGGYCTVYKDNTQVNQMVYTTLPRGVTLYNNYLGKSNWADPYFEGGIGEFALYNKVLNTTELTQNYNAQSDISPPAIVGTSMQVYETTTSVGTFGFTGSPTTFNLTGTDASLFTVNSSGVLTFNSLQNFESPGDSNADRSYAFTVRMTDANGNWDQWSFVVVLLDAIENASISAPTFSGAAYKGVVLTITVSPSGDGTAIPGKVSYFMSGKRIANCYKKTYSGTGNSTCSWEPTVQGNREISVTFTPTNSNFNTATSKKSVFIYRRSTLR